MAIRVLNRVDLPWSEAAHEFVGADQGGVPFTFPIVDAPPGRGIRASASFATDSLERS